MNNKWIKIEFVENSNFTQENKLKKKPTRNFEKLSIRKKISWF